MLLNKIILKNMLFHQVGATPHVANETVQLLKTNLMLETSQEMVMLLVNANNCHSFGVT